MISDHGRRSALPPSFPVPNAHLLAACHRRYEAHEKIMGISANECLTRRDQMYRSLSSVKIDYENGTRSSCFLTPWPPDTKERNIYPNPHISTRPSHCFSWTLPGFLSRLFLFLFFCFWKKAPFDRVEPIRNLFSNPSCPIGKSKYSKTTSRYLETSILTSPCCTHLILAPWVVDMRLLFKGKYTSLETTEHLIVHDKDRRPTSHHEAVSYLLLALIRLPNLNSTHGTGSNATAMNPSRELAQPIPRRSYI